MKRSALIALVALSLVGCTPLLFCVDDNDCVVSKRGADGKCFFDGLEGNHCANPVGDCPSGYRWDKYSGGGIASTCVNSPLVRIDAGLPDLSTSKPDASPDM